MKTLVLALLTLASTAVAADPANEVRCREIAFSLAAEAGDIEHFLSFIDVDARFVGAEVYRGLDEIAAAWGPFFAEGGPRIKWRPQIVEVLEDGTLALSRGPYRLTEVDEDGNTTEYWGTYNSIWRLEDDGNWKIVLDAGSPAAEPPGEAERALLEEENDC